MSKYEELLQRVHGVAEQVGTIFLGELPDETATDCAQARLLSLLRKLEGQPQTSDIERMIVIGALAGLGFEDFHKV